MTASKNVTKTDLTTFKIALRDGKQTLKQVAAEIAGPPAPVRQKPSEVTFPEVPTPKVITAKDRAALAKFPTVFASVVPTVRRVLTEDEIATLNEERETLKVVETLVKGRSDDIGEYIRTHVDQDAIARKVDLNKTPRDKSGHLVLAQPQNPTRIPIKGTNLEFSLQYSAPRRGEASLHGEKVLDLYESGKITRKQYLDLTSTRRVFDEAKATAACVKDPSLLPLLAGLVTYEANGFPSTSLFTRKTQ